MATYGFKRRGRQASATSKKTKTERFVGVKLTEVKKPNFAIKKQVLANLNQFISTLVALKKRNSKIVRLEKRAIALEAQAEKLWQQVEKENDLLLTKVTLLEKHLQDSLGKAHNANWIDYSKEVDTLHGSLYELLNGRFYDSSNRNRHFDYATSNLKVVIKSLNTIKKPYPKTDSIYEVCDWETADKKRKASDKAYNQAVKNCHAGK
jgi:hypothetical protein